MFRRVALAAVLCAALVGTGAAPVHAATTPSRTITYFDPVVGGEVRALFHHNGVIYGGGAFTGVSTPGGEVAQGFLAAWEYPSGRLIETFRPVVNGTVFTISAAPDGNLLVGGNFTTISHTGRTSRGAVAVLDPTTGRPVATPADVRGQVRGIVHHRGFLYVGGRIPRVGAVDAINLVRLTWPGLADDPTWRPDITDGQVRVLDVKDDVAIIGGNFRFVDGVSRGRFFAPILLSTGRLQPGYRNTVPVEVFDFAVSRDEIITANGGGGGRIQFRPLSNLGTPTREVTSDGDAQSIEVRGDFVWIGGHWTRAGAQRLDCRNIVVYERDKGAAYCSAALRGNLGVWAMESIDRSNVMIGGDFNRVDGRLTTGPVLVTVG